MARLQAFSSGESFPLNSMVPRGAASFKDYAPWPPMVVARSASKPYIVDACDLYSKRAQLFFLLGGGRDLAEDL